MEKVLLYQMDSLYRDSFKIYGYHFGGNEKNSLYCRFANEIQQLYMCSMIKTLKLLEERRCLDENLGIMIVPSVNPYSLNTSTSSGQRIIQISIECFQDMIWVRQHKGLQTDFPKSKRLYLWNPFYKLLSRRKFHSACQNHENRI